MTSKVMAQTLVAREVQDLDELFRLLIDTDQPIHILREGVRGVLLRQQDFQALRERLEELEDLEDLLAMREAEAEYRAGEGRPFDEIVADLGDETATYVSR